MRLKTSGCEKRYLCRSKKDFKNANGIQSKGISVFFYVNDHTPMHIHIEKGEGTAKFNLEPIELLRSKRLKASELAEIRKLILENLELFKAKWDEQFNNE